MRLVFFGSPAFAVPSLAALLAADHDVALVVSQPDRPAGRGQRLVSPPVAEYAHAHHLPVWQTPTLRGAEAVERLRALAPDAMALAAFAALVPTPILNLAPHGVLNVHPSLLPRWRGASPIQAALLAGDAETGVSIIRLVQALDAGPILLQKRIPIASEDDYLSLEPRLADLGASLLVESLARLAAGNLAPAPQDDAAATFCGKIERDQARIDWQQPAHAIWNQVRAYRAWPQAYTTWHGKLLKVLRATPLGAEGQSLPAEVPFPSTGPGQTVVSPPGGVPFVASPPIPLVVSPPLVPFVVPPPVPFVVPPPVPFVVSLSNHERGSANPQQPSPGTVLADSTNLVVATGSGLLRLDEVVLEGKRPQSGPDFRRGYPTIAGAVLGI